MREFRFILGRRALIVFLTLLVAVGALLGVSAATRTLAEKSPLGSQEVSAASADSAVTEELPAVSGEEGPILNPSGSPPLLQVGSGDGWTQVTTTPSPIKRHSHAMAATPSGVLLFGGYRSISSNLNDTWLFNTATCSWTKVTGLTTNLIERQAHAMATTPSGVLLFGGSVNVLPFFLSDTWLFNTSTNSWSQVFTSPTPTKRQAHAMATTPSGDVLLFGGYGGSFLNDTWLFNTATCS